MNKLICLVLFFFLSGCSTPFSGGFLPAKVSDSIALTVPAEQDQPSMLRSFSRWAPLLALVGIALFIVGHKSGGFIAFLGASLFPVIGKVADILVAYAVLWTLLGVGLGMVWAWYVLKRRYRFPEEPPIILE